MCKNIQSEASLHFFFFGGGGDNNKQTVKSTHGLKMLFRKTVFFFIFFYFLYRRPSIKLSVKQVKEMPERESLPLVLKLMKSTQRYLSDVNLSITEAQC